MNIEFLTHPAVSIREGVNNLYCFISAASGGGVTVYYTWDWFRRICDSIFVGVMVTIICYFGLRILHYFVHRWCRCLIIKDYKKRKKRK